jgi:hypothetical protein
MNWEALGAIGEIVGAIAVIATLGYLAVQIRHNSRSVEASTRVSVGQARREVNLAIATDPELSELLIRGIADYSSLRADERQRYNMYLRTVFNHIGEIHTHYRRGFATQDLWESERIVLRGLLTRPELREWWRRTSEIFPSELRNEVESIIASIEEPTPAAPQAVEADRP